MKRSLFLAAVIAAAGCLAAPASAQLRRAERALRNQDYQAVFELIDEALAKKPDNAKAFELRGRVHQEMAAGAEGREVIDHFRMMMDDYQRASEIDEKLAKQIQRVLEIAYWTEFQSGSQAFSRGLASDTTDYFFDSALRFEAASVVAPDSSGSYINWAFALLGAGEDVAAIEPLTLALERGEPDLDVYNYLSRIFMANDRAAEAVPLLEEATKFFSNSEELQNNLLNAYVTSNQKDRALVTYKQAVAASPDNKVYRYNYGSLLLEFDRHDDAIEQLAAAVSIDPAYVDAQYNLGAAYVNKAISVNDVVNAIDEELRAGKDSLSADEKSAMEAEIDTLAQERRHLFTLAIPPLEEAKRLGEADERDVSSICRALYTSYVHTNLLDKVPEVEACAGM